MLKDPTIPFTGKDYLDLLRTYDTDSAIHKAYGHQSWAEEQVESYLKASEQDMQDPDYFQPPELSMGLDGLQTVMRVVSQAFLKARAEKIPPVRLRWFEAFLQQCLALIQQEQSRLAGLQAGAQPPAMQPAA